MCSTGEDRSKITKINCSHAVYSAFFTPDGKHVLSGGNDKMMIRRWQVDDGREVGTAIQAGSEIYAVALSMDCKWLVCGLSNSYYGTESIGVWNAETHEKVHNIYGQASIVQSVDISPYSMTFATGGDDARAVIWSIRTGKQLVSLKHAYTVDTVRFSPDGAHLATASIGGSIRIFNSSNGQQLLDIPCSFEEWWKSSPLAWSANGHQIFAVSALINGVKCFDATSGSLVGTWPIPGDSLQCPCIAPSSNQNFIAVAGHRSLSFWDASTHEQVGCVIEHKSDVLFLALSLDDDRVVTGEKSGRVTVRSLRDILPDSYFTQHVSAFTTKYWSIESISPPIPLYCERVRTLIQCLSCPLQESRLPVIQNNDATFEVSTQDDLSGVEQVQTNETFDPLDSSLYQPQLPLIQTTDATFEAWTQGDLSRVEQVLTNEMFSALNPSRHVQVLAQRSLVRSRLKQYNLAIDDATKSLGVQRSAIGQIAITIAQAGNSKHDAAIRMFDLAFANDLSADINLVLLIKAIVLFEYGRHDEAIARVEDLISIVDEKTMYVTARAQMHLLLAAMSVKEGNHEWAAELLGRAGEAVIPENCPELVVISLMFGWNFDGLALTIEEHVQQCMKALENISDIAIKSEKVEEAISSYTAALSLGPSNPAGLLVKRSRARAMQRSWEDALKDADEAIKSGPLDPWGYERRHTSLHALQRYDEAVGTLHHMVSLTENPLVNSRTQCKCHGGGGDAALAHLLEDVMASLGEAAMLAWMGQPSSYNSCLPGTLAIHNQAPYSLPTIDDAETDARVVELKSLMSSTDAMFVYDRFFRVPSTRFAFRRLHLPCILFPVKKLVKKDAEVGEEKCYRARVSGVGYVEFRTSDRLSLSEPRRLAFAHPWIRDLRDPAEEEPCGNSSDSDDDFLSQSDSNVEAEVAAQATEAVSDVAAPLYPGPIATMDISTRALRLVVRLQQPFRGLLLQKQSDEGHKRVAAEHEIVLPGLERRISSVKDVRVEVVEIL